MIRIQRFMLAGLAAALAFSSSASASSVSGSYDYVLTGETSNPGCQTNYGGNPWTDNFASTSGSNSISSDPVTFSICDGITGYLEGGTFIITDGGSDTYSGTFDGVRTGTSGNGGFIFDGQFVATSATGYYSDADQGGTFEVITGGPLGSDAFVTGTFGFETVAPEPMSMLLSGSGLLLLGLSRKVMRLRS